MIEKSKTLAVTGHRTVDKTLDEKKLKDLFISYIEKGIDTFLIGMAVGFDSICFKCLYKLKKKYDIKLICCIPCENQDKFFTDKQKKEYATFLQVSDQNIYVSKTYSGYCMMKRNKFMVDNCSVLVAYLRQDKGGTKQTVDYALTKGVLIEYV